MGTYVKNGNDCVGCSLLEEGFPSACGDCHNLQSKQDLIKLHADAVRAPQAERADSENCRRCKP